MTLHINCRSANATDVHWTPPELALALARIEQLPKAIADPCCGCGNILEALRPLGHVVHGADVVDYGWPHTVIRDFFSEPIEMNGVGIVTNPPFPLAEKFIRKAISDGCTYHAWLLRVNFLQAVKRMRLFQDYPFARLWISSHRFEMHRVGYEGRKTSSNQSYAWFVWDAASNDRLKIGFFDWKVP
jgi:hypothetical protein